MPKRHFVWTKMQAEAGQGLTAIVARKEAERAAGDGLFFWGIGQSLGNAVLEAARRYDGVLPVIWSMMKSKPKLIDSAPDAVRLWQAYEDADGRMQEIPAHVAVTSRMSDRNHHYALVCRSMTPLSVGDLGAFNPRDCTTIAGKIPGASQVTALLRGDIDTPHATGDYRIAFRAELIAPWIVKLSRYQVLRPEELALRGLT